MRGTLTSLYRASAFYFTSFTLLDRSLVHILCFVYILFCHFPPTHDNMPLGLKPCCAVCKTNSSSMWKKGNQGEILCNNCTGKSSSSGTSGPSLSSTTQPSNGGGKQSKQEIHRRSARLRSTKYKAPASEKKVSTKGKGRRHIFKLKNPIKAPESVATFITSESVFYKVNMHFII